MRELKLLCLSGAVVLAFALASVPVFAQFQIDKPSAAGGNGCDQAAVVQGDKVVFPQGATNIVMEPAVVVDEDLGPLATLYPNLDTTTDAFYSQLPCPPSIGGTLPAGANEQPTPDEVASEDMLENFEANNVPDIISGIHKVHFRQFANVALGGCSIDQIPVSCNSTKFLISGQPFEGRDVIYVHGLATEHLEKWLANDPAAHKLWPQDSSEFLNPTGYFRVYALSYWEGHIRENLVDPASATSPIAGYEWTPSEPNPIYKPKSNRYMMVAWSSNQTIEYAQDALVTQILLAMWHGTNVVTPPTFSKRFVRPFCANGCVIISHSTGGLIVSSAMSRAQAGDFGPGAKMIPTHIRAHVAFNGAISGSRLATVAVMLGVLGGGALAPLFPLCVIEDEVFNTTHTCSLNTGFVVHTILRDLIPLVAQQVWGGQVAHSPVPTVTVAGGHPSGNFSGTTKIFLPGLDDGTVSMNSACGNSQPVLPHVVAASGALVTSNVKAFDMGIPTIRAVRNFISQKNIVGPVPLAPPYMAGACTPWLSPTGMVMPVANDLSGTIWDTRRRYPNHFSFVQGSMDHLQDGPSDSANLWPSQLGQSAGVARNYLDYFGTTNNEEMSAITDSGIYAQAGDGTYLVHPAFAAEMYQSQRGLPCCHFKLFGKHYRWWFWKRTYSLLARYESKASTHFVYEFVARR